MIDQVQCPLCGFYGTLEIVGDVNVELYWECPECRNRVRYDI